MGHPGVAINNSSGVRDNFVTVEYIGDGSNPPISLVETSGSNGVQISPTLDGRVAGNNIVQSINLNGALRRSKKLL
jgi:hypothetical protein